MRAFGLRVSAFVALALAVAAMWVGLHVAATGGWILAAFPVLVALACGWASAECMHAAGQDARREHEARALRELLVAAQNVEAACQHHPDLRARAAECVDQLAGWLDELEAESA